jgi:hypothetical protein
MQSRPSEPPEFRHVATIAQPHVEPELQFGVIHGAQPHVDPEF